MRILAIESSAKAASVAIVGGDILESYAYQNTGLTHSRTLMPMVRDALRNADMTFDDVDLIAAAIGPAFTGIRIGVRGGEGYSMGRAKARHRSIDTGSDGVEPGSCQDRHLLPYGRPARRIL